MGLLDGLTDLLVTLTGTKQSDPSPTQPTTPATPTTPTQPVTPQPQTGPNLPINTPRAVKAMLLAPGDEFVNPSTGVVGWTIASYPRTKPYGFIEFDVRLPDGSMDKRQYQQASSVNSISPKN